LAHKSRLERFYREREKELLRTLRPVDVVWKRRSVGSFNETEAVSAYWIVASIGDQGLHTKGGGAGRSLVLGRLNGRRLRPVSTDLNVFGPCADHEHWGGHGKLRVKERAEYIVKDTNRRSSSPAASSCSLCVCVWLLYQRDEHRHRAPPGKHFLSRWSLYARLPVDRLQVCVHTLVPRPAATD
jgi:hypothetical protein